VGAIARQKVGLPPRIVAFGALPTVRRRTPVEVKIRRAIGAPPVDHFARKGHEHVQVVPAVSRDCLPGTRRCRTHGLTTAAVISESRTHTSFTLQRRSARLTTEDGPPPRSSPMAVRAGRLSDGAGSSAGPRFLAARRSTTERVGSLPWLGNDVECRGEKGGPAKDYISED
jgi:hypothetical protein